MSSLFDDLSCLTPSDAWRAYGHPTQRSPRRRSTAASVPVERRRSAEPDGRASLQQPPYDEELRPRRPRSTRACSRRCLPGGAPFGRHPRRGPVVHAGSASTGSPARTLGVREDPAELIEDSTLPSARPSSTAAACADRGGSRFRLPGVHPADRASARAGEAMPGRSSRSPSPTRPPPRCASGSKARRPGGPQHVGPTFHSACVRILRRDAAAAGLKSSFTIYDSADSCA